MIIFAEGIFKGESHVIHPSAAKLKTDVSVPLFPPRNTQVDLHIKVSGNFLQFDYFVQDWRYL